VVAERPAHPAAINADRTAAIARVRPNHPLRRRRMPQPSASGAPYSGPAGRAPGPNSASSDARSGRACRPCRRCSLGSRRPLPLLASDNHCPHATAQERRPLRTPRTR
jgi:hypothetical protein